MTLLQGLALVLAGLLAGTTSALAGGASIISFPVLLAFGVPPLSANVTNSVGLVTIAVGAATASREELSPQRARLRRLVAPSLIGAVGGGILLLSTPEELFEAIVPALIGGSCLLLLAQPWIVRTHIDDSGWRRHAAWASTLVASVYAGYFGAAAGVMLLALLALFSAGTLHQLNALKNVLLGAANTAVMLLFVALAPIRWPMAAALAVGSLAGGATGARLARRIPAGRLRVGIALVGLAVAVYLAVAGP